jgi:predicted RNA-binding protein associated with RNAse of E/G family
MSEFQALIKSGHFGDPSITYGYRSEQLGEVIVERVIWGELGIPRTLAGVVVADTGFVWYRFWLLRERQVVARYYGPRGSLVGTQIDLCTPIVWDATGCSAIDLILDVWIDASGRVTIHNEDEFEAAVASGMLDSHLVHLAETRLRALTAQIARRRFPPPLVRNWQIDPGRIPAVAPESNLAVASDG